MQKRNAPPRIHQIASLAVLPLILAALLTGAAQRIAPGARVALILFPV